jgi:RNA-directed DNA polymerase
MINIDLKDFFHTISFQQVHQLFQKHFKKWNAEMLHLLTEICTYNQRLPMGAPTSPVLSNLVCLNLDHELENYAKYSGITFTRYADDFTFSSKKTLSYKDIQYLLSIIHHYGFIENTDKVKLLQSDDIKIVTGIRVLNERLELPEHYIEQINIEIQRHKIEKIFNQYASPNDKLYIQNIDENNFEKMDILGKAPDIDFILHKQKVLYIG